MTKRIWLAALAAVIWTAGAPARAGDTYLLAGLTGYDGSKTFKVVSTNEFSELLRDAKLDNEALPKAYANLRKAWRDAHGGEAGHAKDKTKTKGQARSEALPIACPPPREVRQLGAFPTAEAADKELKAREAQEAARLKRVQDEKARVTPPPPTETGLKRPPVQAPKNRVQEPDALLQQATLKALIEEIVTVRADIAASRTAGAAMGATPASRGPGERAGVRTTKK